MSGYKCLKKAKNIQKNEYIKLKNLMRVPFLDIKLDSLSKVLNNGKVLTIGKLFLLLLNLIMFKFYLLYQPIIDGRLNILM